MLPNLEINKENLKYFPPGPKGLPLVGQLFERRNRPLELYTRCARDFGDFVGLKIGPVHVVLVSHPDLVKEVLLDKVNVYQKGWTYDILRPLMGNGLLTSEGEQWRRLRKLVQPAFHRQSLLTMMQTMEECIAESLERWQIVKTPFNLHQEMMELTLDVATRTLLGSALSHERKLEISKHIAFLIEASNKELFALIPLPDWVPTPFHLKIRASIEALNQVIYSIIQERRKQTGQSKDLLGLLMASVDEETGHNMTDLQLRDEVITFFLAGHETTANLLTWLWTLLAQNPNAMTRAKNEVGLFTKTPTMDDVFSLEFTFACVQETLRLYPPAWVVARDAAKDDVLRGFKIPKGTAAIISPYVMHRLPQYWESPDEFKPERFLNFDSTRYKNIYIPFSNGPRNCIGSQFAQIEATLITARILQRFHLQVTNANEVRPEPLITLRPDRPVMVTIQRMRETLH